MTTTLIPMSSPDRGGTAYLVMTPGGMGTVMLSGVLFSNSVVTALDAESTYSLVAASGQVLCPTMSTSGDPIHDATDHTELADYASTLAAGYIYVYSTDFNNATFGEATYAAIVESLGTLADVQPMVLQTSDSGPIVTFSEPDGPAGPSSGFPRWLLWTLFIVLFLLWK